MIQKGLILCWCILATKAMYSQKTPIYISGSETMNKMLIALSAAYQKLHPEIEINVKGGHSEKGLEELREGKADICATTKPPVTTIAEEMASFYDDPLLKKVVASEALVVFIHKKNHVQQINCDQLAEIFSGKITNWKQLGGKNGPIKPYRMPDLSGTAQTFQAILMGGTKYASNLDIKNSSGDMAMAVEQDINAIAYGKLVHLNKNIKAVALQDCDDRTDQNFYEATAENIRTGKYFFTRQLYLMTKKKVKPEVKSFVEWVLTPEAQSIVASVGFIPIK